MLEDSSDQSCCPFVQEISPYSKWLHWHATVANVHIRSSQVCKTVYETDLCLKLSVTLPFTNTPVQVWELATEKSRSGGNDLDLYSGGAGPDSWPGHRISWLKFFVAFFSSSRQIPRWYPDSTATAAFLIFSISSLILPLDTIQCNTEVVN
jgi:hypothetical protein